MVIWLIGLSGSGKTTVGKEVFRIWKKKSPQTIFLDGDEVRDIFSNENIDYIDPLNNFINYDQKYYNLFHLYDTNHPNKKGH